MASFFSKPINSLLLAQNKSRTPKAKSSYTPSKKKKNTHNTLISLVIIQKQG